VVGTYLHGPVLARNPRLAISCSNGSSARRRSPIRRPTCCAERDAHRWARLDPMDTATDGAYAAVTIAMIAKPGEIDRTVAHHQPQPHRRPRSRSRREAAPRSCRQPVAARRPRQTDERSAPTACVASAAHRDEHEADADRADRSRRRRRPSRGSQTATPRDHQYADADGRADERGKARLPGRDRRSTRTRR
jgi:hypothetical protein